jgi:hypothetical protein
MTTRKGKDPELIGEVLEPEKKNRELDVRATIASATMELARIQERAAAVKIDGPETMGYAAETVSLAQKIGKALEARRTELTKPLLEEKQAIDRRFKELTDRIEAIKKGMIEKIDAFKAAERLRIQEETRKQEEEAEQRRLQAILEAENAQEELGIEIPADMLTPAPIAPLEAPSARIATASGGIGERKVWLWSVFDHAQVPRAYLMVDGSAITKAVRDGVREIPGVKIYQETKTVAI